MATHSPNPAGVDLFNEAFMRKIEYLHMVSRKAFTGRQRAERKTKKSGSGIEFADHRKYTSGDDFRYIDWNVYGRVDKLLLRLFETEEDLHIYFLIDCSKSMTIGTPTKFDVARKIAATLAYIGLANLDRVGIVPFGDHVHDRFPIARGKGRIFSVFEFLRGIHTGGVTRLSESMKLFAGREKRPGLAVLISDFYDPNGFKEGLNQLLHHRFEPFVLQIFDPSEINPSLFGDLTLVDCETGESRDITMTQNLLDQYRKEHGRYCDELRQFCTARAIPYFQTHTQISLDDLILQIFRQGGFLR